MAIEWVQNGVIRDPYNEFLIQKFENIKLRQNDDLKIDWDNEFKLRFWVDKQNKECVIEPKFLKGNIQKILDAGKSVRLSLYLRSNPQNSEVSKLILEKPNFSESILDELKLQETAHFDLLAPPQLVHHHPHLKERPSFNKFIKQDLYPKTIFKRAQIKTPIKGRWNDKNSHYMDNELNQTPNLGMESVQPCSSLFNELIMGNLSQNFINLESKKIKSNAQESVVSSKEVNDSCQINRRLRNFLEINLNSPIPGFIFHKTMRDIFSKAFLSTSSVIFSNLGHLLHSSFDINKILRTVR